MKFKNKNNILICTEILIFTGINFKCTNLHKSTHWCTGFIFSQKGIIFLGKIKNTGGSKIETGENQVIPASTKGNYKN